MKDEPLVEDVKEDEEHDDDIDDTDDEDDDKDDEIIGLFYLSRSISAFVCFLFRIASTFIFRERFDCRIFSLCC